MYKIKKSPNKRNKSFSKINPERVQDNVIHDCRNNVEGLIKQRVRSLVIPFVRWRLGVEVVGEGFQWGKYMSIKGAKIGRYVYIGSGANFQGEVVVGDLTMISDDCKIIGNDHVFDNPEIPMRINFPRNSRPVTVIGSDVWIGRGVTIMEGVNIGRGSVIAAGSIVTKNVEPYSLMGGVPAKILRVRFDDASIKRNEFLLYNKKY